MTALLHQHQMVTQEIHNVLSARDKILAIGASVMVGVIGYGYAKANDAVLLFAPLAYFLVISYAIFLTIRISVAGGHKQTVEQDINERLGQEVLRWERVAQAHLENSLPTWMPVLQTVVIQFVSSVLSAMAARRLFGTVGMAAAVGLLLASWLTAVWSMWDARRVRSGVVADRGGSPQAHPGPSPEGPPVTPLANPLPARPSKATAQAPASAAPAPAAPSRTG